MLRLITIVLLLVFHLLAIATPGRIAEAQTCPGFSFPVSPLASEKLTASTTAVALTSGTYGKAVMAVVTVEGGSIRYLDNGTAPTATVGLRADAGAVLIICGNAAIAKFQAIRQGAADADLNAAYYVAG